MNISFISSDSFSLNNPLSTNTPVNLSPIALWIKRAATVESIPPLTPQRTFPSIFVISLMKELILSEVPAISKTVVSFSFSIFLAL